MNISFDKAPCIFFIFSNEGIILEVNNTLCSKLGFTQQELIDQNVRKLLSNASRIFFETHFFPLLKLQGNIEEISLKLQAKNKTSIPFLLSGERIIVDGASINVICGLVMNKRQQFEDELISARKAAETALQQNSLLQQAKLELSANLQKLEEQMHIVKKQNEELTQFNHVVTHELQEPLRKVFLFVNMFQSNKDPLKENEIRSKFRNALDLMQLTVSGLQQYVWLAGKELKKQLINLNEVIQNVQHKLSFEYPDLSIELKAEIKCNIEGDKEQFEFLFYELFINAIKFRKGKARVYLKVSSRVIDSNQYKNVKNAYKFTKHLLITVEDKGTGFSTQDKQEVFNLFRKLHKQKGLGIGLALCKKIIENHNGEISIESAENEGTNVLISLPISNSTNE